MKRVIAIIRPFRVPDLREALLHEFGIPGINVTEVKGFGRQQGHTELYRGAEYVVDLLPKARVEIVIANELAQQLIDFIVEVVRTGKVGDGKIFVQNVEESIRISDKHWEGDFD